MTGGNQYACCEPAGRGRCVDGVARAVDLRAAFDLVTSVVARDRGALPVFGSDTEGGRDAGVATD